MVSIITAAIAGDFFAKVQRERVAAFRDFSEAMQRATEELIQDSEYLKDFSVWSAG